MSLPEGVVPKLDNTFTIVGCGESAQNWTSFGHSIGVNDAFKFGKAFDSLLICNRPEQFSKDRLEIIKNTPHKNFYTHKANWSNIFPQWQRIHFVSWYGELHDNQIYSSETSSFIAISLAYSLGAKKIILWGVDLLKHHLFNPDNPQSHKEVSKHLQLINAIKEKGCEVYLGAKGTAFDNHLPVYKENVLA